MTISIYYSGGATNSDPALSIGGVKSSVAVLRRIFRPTAAEFLTGTTLYRCVYVTTDTVATGIKARVTAETPDAGTTVAFGWGVAGVGETEPTIVLGTTPPVGVVFAAPTDYASSVSGGAFGAGASRPFWMRMSIAPATSPGTESFTLTLEEAAGLGLNFRFNVGLHSMYLGAL